MIDWRLLKGRESAAWLLALIMGILFIRERWTSVAIRPDGSNGPGVRKLIEQITGDLAAVDQKRLAENKEALFRVESFDLEISFVVSASASKEAEAKFEVVTLGGKTNISAEKIQKMTLHMKAVDFGKGGSIAGNEEFVPLSPPNQKQKFHK